MIGLSDLNNPTSAPKLTAKMAEFHIATSHGLRLRRRDFVGLEAANTGRYGPTLNTPSGTNLLGELLSSMSEYKGLRNFHFRPKPF